MKSPAFQFYTADFLVGVSGMSDEEIGIYIKMLAYQWERGSLPVCPKAIKKIISSRKIPSEFLIKKFPICDDGNRRNSRLEKEREKQASYRESRSKNANKRWEKEEKGDAHASRMHPIDKCIGDALQSSSSVLPPNPRKREKALAGHLLDLWSAAPAKSRERSSEASVISEWGKIPAADRPSPEKLMASLRLWITSEEWTREAGQFIPGLHRWIKQTKWKITPTQPASRNTLFKLTSNQ